MQEELIQWGILFLFALIGGIIAHKTKLPPVLGLLIVGTLIGPSVFGLVHTENVDLMIELGALLLLFITGLEFEVSKLKKLSSGAFVAAILKVGIVFFTTYFATLVLGYGPQIAALMGVIVSFSSTIVIVKILQQNKLYSRQETPLLIGILVCEDILAIVFLAFFGAASSIASLGAAASTISTIIFGFIVLVALYLLGIRFLKAPIQWVMKNSNEESIIFIDFLILVLFSGIAYFMGISPSIGAFLGGSLIASLPNAHVFEKSVAPFCMFFSALFFIAMGSLVNISAIYTNIVLIGVLLVVILIGRLIGIGLVTNILANFKQEQAVFSSLAMFSVGEFSLLIARQTPSLNSSVDLVSITAAIIFFSAIIMAFSVKKSQAGTAMLSSFHPPGINYFHAKLRLLSTYLHEGFEKLDLETTYTRNLKADTVKGASWLLFAFILGYAWKPALSYAPAHVPLVSIFFGAVVLFFLYLAFRSFYSALHFASFVFSNIHGERNRSKEIIVTLFIFFCLFVTSLYLPLLSSILQWPQASLIAIMLLIVSFGVLSRAIEIIDADSSYKHVVVSFKNRV